MDYNFRKAIRKKFFIPLALIIFILVIGYFGFIYLEGYNPLESVYMIITTFLMIGYGEIKPLSDSGRVFNMILIISGFSVGLYAIGQLSTFFIEGEFLKLLKIRKMNKKLSILNDHYIVCGYGKTGKKVIDELLKQKLKVVLIESDLERIEKLKELYDDNLIHITGDATHDEILIHAGIEHAKYLISVLVTDAENLFVTLSAKDLNKNIKVITRVDEANSTLKFKKAGADYIISPIEIASERIISIVTPGSDFFSFLNFTEKKEEFNDYKFSVVEINSGSNLIDKTYREANIPQRTNLVVMGFYSISDVLQVNPKADDLIQLGDKLLVFGKEDQINSLKQIANQ